MEAPAIPRAWRPSRSVFPGWFEPRVHLKMGERLEIWTVAPSMMAGAEVAAEVTAAEAGTG